MDAILDRCPTNMSGADFYSLASTACMNSIRRKIQMIELGKPNKAEGALDQNLTEVKI